MSMIIFSVIKALLVWAVILFVGTNLTGMVGRGLLEKSLDKSDHFVTLISAIATVGILIFVYNLWGTLALSSIVLIMASRVPDLYWEVRLLPKELGVAYPVPKPLIQEAIKAKSHKMPWWDIIVQSFIWIALLLLIIHFI